MKHFLLKITYFSIFAIIIAACFFYFVDIYTPTRWISLACIYITYFMVVIQSFEFPFSSKNLIYGYPKLHLAVILFFLELLAGIYFIVKNDEKYTFPLLIQGIIIGFGIAKYIILIMAEDITVQNDEIEKKEIEFIQYLSGLVRKIFFDCKDKATAKKLENLYDTICSSTIKSIPEVAQEEYQLIIIIDKIVEKSEKKKFCEIQDLIKNAKTILSQREEKLRQKRNV